MKRPAALVLAACLALGPVRAQEVTPEPESGSGAQMEDGLDLLGQGMRLFFEGLGNELEPALRDLAQQMEPALRELMALIEDFDAYQMPEKLPNGDIIIRRKPDLPPQDIPQPGPGGEIEL